MQTMLVPHAVEASSARMWIGVTGAPAPPGDIPIKLSNGAEASARADDWRAVTAGGVLTADRSRTFAQVVRFPDLPARTRFAARANEAEAGFVTLPETLPRVGERPFTVLLGSCYFGDRDRGVSALAQALFREVQVDMKILTGDQVYLDFPSLFLGVPFSEKGQADLFLSKYLRNWGSSRYGSLLREGATYFTADDHEFWNNYPNPATIISPSWTASGREKLRRVAGALFQDFQAEPGQDAPIRQEVRVGNLSFMIVDTRRARGAGDDVFIPGDDLAKIVDWLDEPGGAGVLVVGQPIFAEPHTGFLGGLKQRFADRDLPDYAQYRLLSDALRRARRPVLILSGDVHYPRVAEAIRPGEASRELFEVIASPAALVAGSHRGSRSAPDHFPAKPGAGPALPLRTYDASRHAGDNVAVLEFTETPGKIHVQLKYWFIGAQPAHGPVIHFSLTQVT